VQVQPRPRRPPRALQRWLSLAGLNVPPGPPGSPTRSPPRHRGARSLADGRGRRRRLCGRPSPSGVAQGRCAWTTASLGGRLGGCLRGWGCGWPGWA
jgi:hypothetical protein